MDISEMGGRDKSAALIKAMGWQAENSQRRVIDHAGEAVDPFLISWTTKSGEMWINFYRPINMALAWQVHEWGMKTPGKINGLVYVLWWKDRRPYQWDIPNAQRRWLDKVLELAIEAGLVS
jgi:hypothetical protein